MAKIVWALEDDRMGSVGQIKGVIEALDQNKYQVVEKSIKHSRLAKLPNCLLGSSLMGITKESKQKIKQSINNEQRTTNYELRNNFPDLVISGSRRTAPVARWIKKKSRGKTKIIQLMHPGNCGLKDFDLVFVAKHDAHKKTLPNFRFMIGSPHRVTEKALKTAAERWLPEFQNLPRPLTAVIVGGSIKGHPFALENAMALGRAIKSYHAQIGGSILITTSRRTGDIPERAIMNYIKDIPSHQYLWGTPGDNPIMGYWACADSIIATGDSVSMVSESCGTGKPVFIFTGQNWLTKKHLKFTQSLFDETYAAPLGSAPAFKPAARLDPASYIAQQINTLF